MITVMIRFTNFPLIPKGRELIGEGGPISFWTRTSECDTNIHEKEAKL